MKQQSKEGTESPGKKNNLRVGWHVVLAVGLGGVMWPLNGAFAAGSSKVDTAAPISTTRVMQQGTTTISGMVMENYYAFATSQDDVAVVAVEMSIQYIYFFTNSPVQTAPYWWNGHDWIFSTTEVWFVPDQVIDLGKKNTFVCELMPLWVQGMKIRVRARDKSGNVEARPAVVYWTRP